MDLSAGGKLVDLGQLKAIALAIVYAKEKYINQQLTIPEILEKVSQDCIYRSFIKKLIAYSL